MALFFEKYISKGGSSLFFLPHPLFVDKILFYFFYHSITTIMLLAIETSCDDSSVALLDSEGVPIVSLISSQIDLHGKFGGVVPEIASRAHLNNLPLLIRHALNQAGLDFKDIEAIGVTNSPGLVGALLVGVTYAKTLAWLYDIPLIPVDHLEGHLLASFLDHPELDFPYLGLVASGGHTHLYVVRGFGDYILLGKTLDDAVGEAYDKVAKMLGFLYPGGPIVDRIAQETLSPGIPFPIPFKGKKTLNFSYSGLKTAVRNKAMEMGLYVENTMLIDYETFARWPDSERKKGIKNIMAGFQTCIVESISKRFEMALLQTGIKKLVLTGGVASNSALRQQLSELAAKKHASFYYPNAEHCTDNAAMIGYVAWKFLQEGLSAKVQMNLDVSSRSRLTLMDEVPFEDIAQIQTS